jgi:glycerate kinase
MKILIAPDKFKGSLTAREVAQSVARGLSDVLQHAVIEIVPMADGGEGTAEAICNSLGCAWVDCCAHDPLGRVIDARYGWLDEEKLAVMEMSEAAGMRRLTVEELDPIRASTFGVGEMLLDATMRGARQIIIGLGGSATNDGGFGMARALGFGFEYERRHKQLPEQVTDLLRLAGITKPQGLNLPKITAAVDVQNPLLGANGATRVFGSQKGASERDLQMLERALTRMADVVARAFGFDYRDEPGAGAAGGLGFGLMSFCGAQIRLGFDVVAEAVGLESRMREAEVVITGEGSLDRQTLEGKTPAGVARLARKLGKPVWAIVGRSDDDPQVSALFHGVLTLDRRGLGREQQMQRAAELLRDEARALAKQLQRCAF